MTDAQSTQGTEQSQVRYLEAAGKYRAKAIDWGLDARGENQTPCLAVEFEVVDGPAAGARIYHWIYFTERSLENAVVSLRRMGWKGDDLSTLGDPNAGLGTVVEIDCQTEEYQGKTELKVKWVNEAGGARRRNPPPAAFAGFAETMRARVAGIGAQRSPKGDAHEPGPSAATANGPAAATGKVPF